MAVTVATGAFDNTPFGASSRTFAYTHGGGPLVVVAVSRSVGVSGVTANGSAMSSLGSNSDIAALNIGVWYLNDIASFSAQNIVITYAGTTYYGVTHVLSLAGATSTPFSAFNSAFNSGGSTAPSVTITSASGELVIASLVNVNTAVTHTIGSGQTLVRDDAGTNGTDTTNAKQRIVTTTEAGASSVVMDGTLSGSAPWVAVGFSVAASGGGGGGGSAGVVHYLNQRRIAA